MKTKQTPLIVHFVCRGNTYRSRLAAAYMEGLVDARFSISSSGISATGGTIKTAELYTQATANAHGLHIGGLKRQTTSALLQAADVIIFMNKDVYDDACKSYDFDIRKAQVWHVKDMDPVVKQEILKEQNEAAWIAASAHTFKLIRKHCDQLYAYLTSTAWVDVVDATNTAAGLRLPMAWVADRGLWHRGVHVVVQTADGKFVVGKRSNTIVFAPGMLEISLGGGIDSGELPLEAAQRETHEELGIQIAAKHFRPLFLYKLHSYHPHYNKHTRCHLYVYSVTLPIHSARLQAQPSEVAEIRLLTKRQVHHVLRTHRMEHFGRLKWGYKLYAKAVAYTTAPVA
jgi:protein-tyrosine-phosphatase/8-oxo-dGTP pyrophosphatase MutT (NUDIX family)